MPDIYDDLDRKLAEASRPPDAPEGAEETQEGGGWRVKSLDDASWASRKVAEAHRCIADIEAWAQRERERIEAIVARETATHERTIYFFTGHLAAWMREELKSGRQSRKSIELAGGVFKLTKRQPKIELNEQVFMAWAKASAPNLVRTQVKESPNLSAIREFCQLAEEGRLVVDGEIVEGATWEPQEDAPSFKPAEK